MAQSVIIEHPKTGERYGIEARDFGRANLAPDGAPKQTYEDRGFVIVSNMDGTPYEAPERKQTPKKGE